MKRFLSILLIVIIIGLPTSTWGSEVPKTEVYVDGIRLFFDVPPQSVEGRTLVPLRTIFEALGLKVAWESETQRITGIKDGLTIEVWLDRREAFINGKAVVLDVAPTSVSGRTLVPVRFIAEATGANVNWISETREVIIKSRKLWQDNIYVKTIEDYPRCNTYGVLAEAINIGDVALTGVSIRVNYLNASDEVVEYEDIHIDKVIEAGKGHSFYSTIGIGDYLITNISFEIFSSKL